MIHSLQNGKFAIHKILGNGGFGITYEATNTLIDKRVAIKEFFMADICMRGDDDTTVVVTSDTKRDLYERQKERFVREAIKLAHLTHPNIVAVHDLFEENGTAYYVMDYVEGENLADHLRRTGQPMKESEVLDILSQVLNALEYIHGQEPPLLHLDIKPANIIVNEKGDVKLLDFGASKMMPQDDQGFTSTSFPYTPNYAPIEQMYQDIKKIGPWTDFYSLGATLYNLLTNCRPPNPSSLSDDHTSDKHIALSFPNEVSERTRILVAKLMAVHFNQRPQSVEEIRSFLEGKDFPKQNKIIIDEPSIIGGTNVSNDITIIDPKTKPQKDPEKKEIIRQPKKRKNRIGWIVGVLAFLILAIVFFLKSQNSAKQRVADSEYELGNSYFYGINGKELDYAKALEWWRESAEHGNANAQYKVGICYGNGYGIERNDSLALEWLEKAAPGLTKLALQENADAQYHLGYCYEYGNGKELNDSLAKVWYSKAVPGLTKLAEQDNAVAQYLLGYCYDFGKGAAEDKQEAAKWYRKAAEQGHAVAQCSLGYCYANGEGVNKDEQEAVKWYIKSAEKGFAVAQYNLGVCYANGEGVDKDKQEAVKLYLKAAEQGNADAQCNLGVCYENGEGVTKDMQEAVKWYRKAAEQGDADAKSALGNR